MCWLRSATAQFLLLHKRSSPRKKGGGFGSTAGTGSIVHGFITWFNLKGCETENGSKYVGM
jgi:hypothetical protein